MIMNWFEIVVIWFLTVLCNRQSEKDMLSLSGCRENKLLCLVIEIVCFF